MNTDNWHFTPTRMLMHPRDYRDLVVWALVEDGWSPEDAVQEAERRLAILRGEDDESDLLTGLGEPRWLSE